MSCWEQWSEARQKRFESKKPGGRITGVETVDKMNVPHTFQNIGDEPGAFLSVKGPKPVDLVILEDQK
jgi:hypothetical protein